ncbi:hypothetical protein RFI_07859 [Reticulomyxa filosa]|uniref:RGS domain-containing protein n=1 Tax=Reticulomyxa filosa TaxID=46433 RepID=X6NTI5_RETFI|nr:hypothetical protein RFI_07859 [Reticulomyxa filosa]|eukprot:ETO29263.1 hypothetical protein RFI_07859 [Reticulomyxa filosa]
MIYYIRHVWSQFSVKQELTAVAILEAFFSAVMVVFVLFFDPQTRQHHNTLHVLYLNLTRTIGLFAISMIWPVYRTFFVADMPQLPNQDVIASLRTILTDGEALTYFHDFMNERGAHAIVLLSFWMEIGLFHDVCDNYQAHLHSMFITNTARRGPSGGAVGVSGSVFFSFYYYYYYYYLLLLLFVSFFFFFFSIDIFHNLKKKGKQKLDNLQQNVCAQMSDLYKKYFEHTNTTATRSPAIPPNGNSNSNVNVNVSGNAEINAIQQIVGERICEEIISRMEEFRNHQEEFFQGVESGDATSINTDRSAPKKNVLQSTSNHKLSYRDVEWQSPSSHEYGQGIAIPTDIFDAAQKAVFQHMETFYYQL